MKSGTCFFAGLAVILCLIQVTLAKAKSSAAANHPPRPAPGYFIQPQHHFPVFPHPQPPTYFPHPYPPHPQPRPPVYPPHPYPPYPQPPPYKPYPPHPQPQPPTYPPFPPHPQPQPPKVKCDLCTKVKDGVEMTLDTLQMIDDQVTPTNDCPSDFRFVTGNPSNSAGGTSEAVCPPEFDVIDCRCDIESDDCDGTAVTGKTCTATKASAGAPSIRAQATCVPSCSGTFTYKTAPSDGTFADTPTVICDANTEIIGCWAFDRANIFVGTSIDVAMNSCSAASSCGSAAGTGCQVQAVCQAV